MQSTRLTFAQHRKHARIAGALFLFTIGLYATGDHLIKTAFDNPSAAFNMVQDYHEMVFGALLLFTNALCVTVIGITLFPVISYRSPAMALGYLSTRTLEAIILTIGIIGLLVVISVCETQEALLTHTTISHLARRTQFWSYQLSMIVLGIGSTGACYVLYKTRLLPSFIGLWGMCGYVLLVIGSLLECFAVPAGLILSIPGGLFELTFGVWLIVKGLNTEAMD